MRVLFQDEARFGRSQEPGNFWAPKGIRPNVVHQLIRSYLYAYGAVSPRDGKTVFLILPNVTASTMNIFLAEVARCFSKDFLLMFYDGAPGHSQSALDIPQNMLIEKLPAYCPELNPTEHLWDSIREHFFLNQFFSSLNAVENKLVEAMQYFDRNPEIVKSITGFKWIIKAIKDLN